MYQDGRTVTSASITSQVNRFIEVYVGSPMILVVQSYSLLQLSIAFYSLLRHELTPILSPPPRTHAGCEQRGRRRGPVPVLAAPAADPWESELPPHG